jgi:hypothetical protein
MCAACHNNVWRPFRSRSRTSWRRAPCLASTATIPTAVVPRVSCESDAREQPRWSASCVSRLEKPPIPELHDLPPEDPRIQLGLYLRAMKHSLVLLFGTLSLRAQAPAPQSPNSQPAAKSGQTPADQPDAPRPELQPFTAPENPGVEPAPPIVEPTWFTGSIDAGCRWISGVGGDIPTYRSTINLGEGRGSLEPISC